MLMGQGGCPALGERKGELWHHSLPNPGCAGTGHRLGMEPWACPCHPPVPTHARGPEQSHLFSTPKECWEALKPTDYSPKQRPGLLPALAGNKQPGEALPKGSARSWFTL